MSQAPNPTTSSQLQICGEMAPGYEGILTPRALAFLEKLIREFGPVRDTLLANRILRQREIDGGVLPDFLPHTESIRSGDWTVAPIPDDLRDRRVEITGPVERKMIINALNSGANVFMADFEDANAPTWSNTIQGQLNLRDAVRRTIRFESPDGRTYRLNDKTATLFVRPRGFHLPEKHLTLDGTPVPASFVDFGLFFFHNAAELLARGTGPYFYLPKLQSHLEARLWNDIFSMAQRELGVPHGSVRATVLIETIHGAFEMNEILYELRDHSAGLNCGRWDYIFSIIKTFRGNERFTLPDRGQVTMMAHCMRAYSRLTIQTCHRRGVHAMGGMAAQIPIRNDATANELALSRVRADKVREVSDGHDGTWVAHPGLVGLAREAFDERMQGANQLDRRLEDLTVTSAELLTVPTGSITEGGIRHNIDVGIQYLEAWLSGNGCVPIYNLMEDAATAEISRSQLWQWLHHSNAILEDGRAITPQLITTLFDQELENIRGLVGEERFAAGHYQLARKLIEDIVTREEYCEFMTLIGYEYFD